MNCRISTGRFRNSLITLPFSKSIINRLAIIYGITGGIGELKKYSSCDDTGIIIDSISGKDSLICDVGASGTALRFLTAYFSLFNREVTITGTERLCQRPISELVDMLNSLGANITYTRNAKYPPIRIGCGHIDGGRAVLEKGNISSQYVSALMLIAPEFRQKTVITLPDNIVSKAYIDMTKSVMQYFGARVEYDDRSITVYPTPYTYRPMDVEGDWSAASYWFEMVALTPDMEITFSNLHRNSVQGDSYICTIYDELGVNAVWHNGLCTIGNKDACKDVIDISLANYPDTVPSIVVTCLLKNIHFNITDIGHLRFKESDRISSLTGEAKRLGFIVKWDDQRKALFWDGERCNYASDIRIDTHHDHRIAMAFAPAAIKYDNIIINDTECVNKSYNNFWKDLCNAGFNVKEEKQ